MTALDIGGYLERIGVTAAASADLATLAAIHSGHALGIPFENLDIHRGLGISLELPDVYDKLVTRRRGGYCFEHNALLAWALEQVGFQVTRLCGRVWIGKVTEGPPPRTHMTLVVDVDGAE